MKALEFNRMTTNQKSDIEFVSEQESIWVDTTGADGTEAQKYTKLTDKLIEIEQAKTAKLAEKIEHESEKQKQHRQSIERHEKYWTEWFKTNDMYFVSEDKGTYYRYVKQTRDWVTC